MYDGEGTDRGLACIFHRHTSPVSWNLADKFDGGSDGDSFGISVAIEGFSRATVGAHKNDHKARDA